MSRNYEEKLSGNIQLVYYDEENVGIIGILAYPKINLSQKYIFTRINKNN